MSQLFCPVVSKVVTFELEMSAHALANVWDKSACICCRSECQNRNEIEATQFRVREAYVTYAIQESIATMAPA